MAGASDAEPRPGEDRGRAPRWRRSVSTTAGRASSPPAPRSTGSSSTPAISRSPRRRPAASKPATCCTPSIASARCVEDGGSLADAADALEADSEASNEVESLPLEPGRSRRRPAHEPAQGEGARGGRRVPRRPVRRLQAAGRRPHRARRRAGARLVQGREEVGRVVRREAARRARRLGAHEAAEEPFLDAEENRLLYVAATRARQMLVVSRWTAQKGNAGVGCAERRRLAAAKELPVPAAVEGRRVPKPAACCRQGAGRGADAARQPRRRVNQPSWSITSVTAEARHIATMARPRARRGRRRDEGRGAGHAEPPRGRRDGVGHVDPRPARARDAVRRRRGTICGGWRCG